MWTMDLPEYVAIQRHYGDRVAERSRVSYMQHIDEGIAVLKHIGASEAAIRAFCAHPLVARDHLGGRYPLIAAP